METDTPPRKTEAELEGSVPDLVRKVELLTNAVASLANCLQRGPCWGSTGEVGFALQKAWRLIEETRAIKPNDLTAAANHEWERNHFNPNSKERER